MLPLLLNRRWLSVSRRLCRPDPIRRRHIPSSTICAGSGRHDNRVKILIASSPAARGDPELCPINVTSACSTHDGLNSSSRLGTRV